MATDRTLAEVLALMTKVSTNMDARLERLEKTTGQSSNLSMDGEKKPRQVVEQAKPVIVTDFGRKAEQDLTRLGGGDGGDDGKDGKDKSGLGGLAKLILPAILAAGSLAALFKGLKDAGGPLTGIMKILGKGGLQLAMKSFSKALKPFSKGLKGFIQSFSKLVAKPIGKIMGKVGAKGFFSSITKVFGKFLKPVLKRIPGIGSLISWGFAYSRFKNGDLIGGMIDLASGIATLFPGVGTGIGIGLDILNAFLDVKAAKAEEKGQTKGDMLKEFFGKIIDKIKNSFPIKNLLGFVDGIKMMIGGDFKGGGMKIAESLPGFSAIKRIANMVSEAKAEATGEDGKFSFKKFFVTLKNKIFGAVLKIVPKRLFGFALRSKVADFLGVPGFEDEGDEGVEEISEAENVNGQSAMASTKTPEKEALEHMEKSGEEQLEETKKQNKALETMVNMSDEQAQKLRQDNLAIIELLTALVENTQNIASGSAISQNTTIMQNDARLRSLQAGAAY
tara:strand:+ start:118 stop:1629 length:1512 start_codon:yes stop_codon:yes gene_type:complete